MNKNVEERDKILFGCYEPEKYYGGIRDFDASYKTILELREKDFINENERQNNSPSFLEFTEILGNHTDDVMFEGYAVSPNRSDYRITLTGIRMIFTDNEYDVFPFFIEEFREADEFEFYHEGNSYYLRAWWD